jgi:hypothetical protein
MRLKSLPLLCLPILLVALVGCPTSGKDDDDSADTAGGGSGGSGSGSGGGTADLDDEICDDPPEPATADSACISGTLECGSTVIGTTEGGTTNLTGADYASFWACAVVGTSSYQGPERHYEFQHPGTGTVTITLDTPCEDLDLFAMRWESASCMQSGLSILECEGDVSSGGGSFEIWNNEPGRYVVVVEGANGEEAPFEIGARCP